MIKIIVRQLLLYIKTTQLMPMIISFFFNTILLFVLLFIFIEDSNISSILSHTFLVEYISDDYVFLFNNNDDKGKMFLFFTIATLVIHVVLGMFNIVITKLFKKKPLKLTTKRKIYLSVTYLFIIYFLWIIVIVISPHENNFILILLLFYIISNIAVLYSLIAGVFFDKFIILLTKSQINYLE